MNNKQEKTIETIQAAFPASPFYIFPYGESEKVRNEPWKARIMFTHRLDKKTGNFLVLSITGKPLDKNHLAINGETVQLKNAVSYIKGVVGLS